ncbi:SPOR domain-containing protein [Providencia manganoxydans]|uniref:SPOR domain-containing protein n=1 Tax=Providencia TaxID=586 RepID=UPI0024B08061|nr:SPOR domain-containing protein [Providencia sp. 2023EL-00965]MDW7590481.1 SPOR domain-containing protein [Providencia sp. 2023EL-00965]
MPNFPYYDRIIKYIILFFILIIGLLRYSTSLAKSTAVEIIHDKGVQLINGDGVPVDLVKGRYYIHQSAMQGYSLGQFHLGILFYTGDGGVQDNTCAELWLKKAAQAEDEVHNMALDALSDIYEETAMLSSKPRVVSGTLNEALCQQLPDLTMMNKVQVNDIELTLIEAPKIDPNLLGNAIISVPKLYTLTKIIGQQQLPLKIAAIPRLNYAISWASQFYQTAFDNVVNKWSVLAQLMSDNHQKAPQRVAYKVNAERIRPLDIARNPPEPAEEVIITILLSPEQEAELAKNRQGEVLTPMQVPMQSEDDNLFVYPAIEPSHVPLELEANIMLAQTLSELPEDPLIHSVLSSQTPLPIVEKKAPVKMMVSNTPTPVPTYNLGGDPRNASPKHYTLQVGSASSSAGLYDQARRYKLSNYLVYETVRNGRQWYVLVYGEYPNMSSAKRALKTLPSAIQRDKPWIRSLQHVQSEL